MPEALHGLMGGSNAQALRPQLDPAATSIEFDYRPVRANTVALIFAGFALVPIALFFFWLIPENEGVRYFLPPLTGLVGLCVFILGLGKLSFRKQFYLTSTTANVTASSAFGTDKWVEHLGQYEGVQLERLGYRNGKREHAVNLFHANPRRTLTLWVDREYSNARAIQEAFSKRFKLPTVAFDAGKIAKREPRSLNQTVVDRVARPTSRETPVADPGPPPARVKVKAVNGEMVITIREFQKFHWWPAVIAVAILGAGAFIGYWMMPLEDFINIFGSLFISIAAMIAFVWVLWKMAALFFSSSAPARDQYRHQIRVGPAGVRIQDGRNKAAWPDPKKTAKAGGTGPASQGSDKFFMPANAIEQIRLEGSLDREGAQSAWHKSRTARNHMLYIESDKARLKFRNASYEQLNWVRNYLLFQLSIKPDSESTRQ